jgi:hypothetical protein
VWSATICLPNCDLFACRSFLRQFASIDINAVGRDDDAGNLGALGAADWTNAAVVATANRLAIMLLVIFFAWWGNSLMIVNCRD